MVKNSLEIPTKSELLSDISAIMGYIQRGVEYKKLESNPLLLFKDNFGDLEEFDEDIAYEYDPNEPDYIDLGYAFDTDIEHDLMELKLKVIYLQSHPKFDGLPNNVIQLEKALKNISMEDKGNPDKLAKHLSNVDFNDNQIQNKNRKVKSNTIQPK